MKGKMVKEAIKPIISSDLSIKDAFNIIAPKGANWDNYDHSSLLLMILETKTKNGDELLVEIENIRTLVEMVADKLTKLTKDEKNGELADKLFDIYGTLSTFLDGIELGRKVASVELQR